MSFLGEIKRRKVFQVAAVYAIVAWVLIQIIVSIEEPLGLPGWMDTFVIVVVIAGFPLAVVLSWAYDMTPAGIVRTKHLKRSDEISQQAIVAAAQEEGSPADLLPNSVAVLPLENLSPDPNDAYFAAGIHEEILNYLTKIKGLSVIARTSVKKYADTDKSIAEIAGELGVGTVMEGSVRYAGERVRVTAQLIDASTENHLWSEVYERDLADVFAIQADIAEKIAEALEAEFSAVEKRSIETLPTTSSSAAHALYLKSQALFGQDDTAIAVTAPPSIRASIQSNLDQAIALDPEFALPYALKALLYAISKIYDPVRAQDWLESCTDLDKSVRLNAEKALQLNATLGLPHFALALHHQLNWRSAQAREAYDRSLELRPNDSNMLVWYATLKWSTDEIDDAVRLAKKAVTLDPGNAYVHNVLGIFLNAAGDRRASADSFEKARIIHPGSALPYIIRAVPENFLGNEQRALEGIRIANQLLPDAAPPAIHIHLAYCYARLGQREDAEKVINKVEAMIGDRFVDPIVWVFAHLAAGDPGQALRSLTKAVEEPQNRQEIFARTFIKQNSWFDPVLDQAEFIEMRNRLGFQE